jgi:hypothetical protein
MLSKYGFGIRDLEKTYPDPGSRGQKGTGSQIRIRNIAHKFSMKWVNIFHAAGASSVWYGTVHFYMVLSGYSVSGCTVLHNDFRLSYNSQFAVSINVKYKWEVFYVA